MIPADAYVLDMEYRPGDPPRVSVRFRRFLFETDKKDSVYGDPEVEIYAGDDARAIARKWLTSPARWA